MMNSKAADKSFSQEISEYWDGRAGSFSNEVCEELQDSRHEAWTRVLKNATADQRAEAQANTRPVRALDLGCGPGFLSIVLAELSCEVDAVDASGEMLHRAHANVKVACPDAHVAFHAHDVSRLPFENYCFDVVVSRNLTWLMREPVEAYREWLRVLRPGGKMLAFDANWYLYLVDPEIDAKRKADQIGKVPKDWSADSHATSDQEIRCEEIARKLPLTPVIRPAWDLRTLNSLGVSEARADESIWQDVWTESEKAFYASSPLFMIEAVK